MNNKKLWIIFAVLLGLFLLSKLFTKQNVRSFTTDIIQVDADKVDKVVFHLPEGTDFHLSKNGENWMVSDDKVTADALASVVNSLMSNLNQIKAERPVAKSKDKWESYEVDEAKGKRIELFSGPKKLEDLVIGRFNFNQQARSAKSYIRRSNDDNVYAIDGFLSMSISQSMDSFRDKKVIDLASTELTAISLESESGTTSLRKENLWIDQDGNVKDSTAMVNFVNKLTKVNGVSFYNATPNTSDSIKKLMLSGGNGQSTVVSCFQENGDFIIHSSQNPNAYFSSDSTGIFKTLFLDELLMH